MPGQGDGGRGVGRPSAHRAATPPLRFAPALRVTLPRPSDEVHPWPYRRTQPAHTRGLRPHANPRKPSAAAHGRAEAREDPGLRPAYPTDRVTLQLQANPGRIRGGRPLAKPPCETTIEPCRSSCRRRYPRPDPPLTVCIGRGAIMAPEGQRRGGPESAKDDFEGRDLLVGRRKEPKAAGLPGRTSEAGWGLSTGGFVRRRHPGGSRDGAGDGDPDRRTPGRAGTGARGGRGAGPRDGGADAGRRGRARHSGGGGGTGRAAGRAGVGRGAGACRGRRRAEESPPT